MASSRRRRRKRKRRSLDTSRLTRKQVRARVSRRRAAPIARAPRDPIPIRTASFGGVKAKLLSIALRSRLANVARQKLSQVPVVGNLFRTTRAARIRSQGNMGLAVQPSTAIATRSRAATLARRTVVFGASGAAFEGGSQILQGLGGVQVPSLRRRGGARRGQAMGIPFQPGGIVPTDSITHTWVANGVPFAQLADGRVMVRRKNGTIKTFRRPKPIVLGRNPSVRQLVRADKKIDQLLKLVRKRFPPARRRQHSQTHN